MATDPHALLARPFAPVDHAYEARDTILYALGVGMGHDPMDTDALRFVYEDGLAALPTLANVLGHPGFWAMEPDTGIDWRRVVHAEQSLVLHRAVPAAGRVAGHTQVTAFHDKGASRGALLATERRVVDAASGAALATVTQLAMLRGDGGSGVVAGTLTALDRVPVREPDAVCELATRPEAALIYRLSGDLNPLHADPAVARAAGFGRPILHGLATMGVACHAVLRTMLGWDAGLVRGMAVRFSAPVTPGDVVRTEMWRGADGIAFRALVEGRVVLDRGWVGL